MNYRDEIEHWAKKWDAAQEKWAKEPQQTPAQQPQKSDSFFGLQSNPLPSQDVNQQQGDEWWSIYTRSAEIRDENPQPETTETGLFHEQAQGWKKLLGTPPSHGTKPAAPRQPQAQQQTQQQARQPNQPKSFREQAEGWRNLLTPPGKDVTFFQHPQHHTSIGMDQSKSPYEPTRVAPNFTDGTELRALNDLKMKLERLESTLLSNEIKAGKANVPAGDYKGQLDKLRTQIDALSEKLTPTPGTDVY